MCPVSHSWLMNVCLNTFLVFVLCAEWCNMEKKKTLSDKSSNKTKSSFHIAWQDASYGTLPSCHLFSPAVLWCCSIPANEWEEAHLDLSRLWQKSHVWESDYWWVRLLSLSRKWWETLTTVNCFAFIERVICIEVNYALSTCQALHGNTQRLHRCWWNQVSRGWTWCPMRPKKEMLKVSSPCIQKLIVRFIAL